MAAGVSSKSASSPASRKTLKSPYPKPSSLPPCPSERGTAHHSSPASPTPECIRAQSCSHSTPFLWVHPLSLQFHCFCWACQGFWSGPALDSSVLTWMWQTSKSPRKSSSVTPARLRQGATQHSVQKRQSLKVCRHNARVSVNMPTVIPALEHACVFSIPSPAHYPLLLCLSLQTNSRTTPMHPKNPKSVFLHTHTHTHTPPSRSLLFLTEVLSLSEESARLFSPFVLVVYGSAISSYCCLVLPFTNYSRYCSAFFLFNMAFRRSADPNTPFSGQS